MPSLTIRRECTNIKNCCSIIAPEFEQRLGAYKEVKAGESLTFTGTYRAFPTPTVKWYKDEEELQDAERRRFDTSVDQVMSTMLLAYIN